MRLRLRVRPKEGEDVIGLALRLTQRGEYPHFHSFLRLHGVNLDLASFDDGLNRTAELAGLPCAPLRQWSLRPVSPQFVMFRGEKLPKQVGLLARYRRFCPLCFDDDFRNAPPDEPEASVTFIRSWWRTTLVYACPVHKVAMLNSCPSCDQRISDKALPLHRCPCGQELRDAKPVDLLPGDLIANDYFLGRLSLAAPIECPVLDRIPLCEVMNVLRRLGAAALLGKREQVKISVGQLDKELACDQAPAIFGKLLSTGFEYARDGSASLLRLLETMVEGDRRLYAGPADLVGQKFRAWAVHKDNPIRETILAVWDPFIAKHCRPTRRTAAYGRKRDNGWSGPTRSGRNDGVSEWPDELSEAISNS